jgi:hypothetical protein
MMCPGVELEIARLPLNRLSLREHADGRGGRGQFERGRAAQAELAMILGVVLWQRIAVTGARISPTVMQANLKRGRALVGGVRDVCARQPYKNELSARA